MPLDPKAKAVIDFMAQIPMPPWAEVDPVAYRAASEAGRFPPPDLALAEITDSTIPGPGGPIAVRIYRASLDDNQPAIVYFHGGGFVIGSLNSHDGTCRRLCHNIGCAVVSVDPSRPLISTSDDIHPGPRPRDIRTGGRPTVPA